MKLILILFISLFIFTGLMQDIILPCERVCRPLSNGYYKECCTGNEFCCESGCCLEHYAKSCYHNLITKYVGECDCPIGKKKYCFRAHPTNDLGGCCGDK